MKLPVKNQLFTGLIAGLLVMAISFGILKLILSIPTLQAYAADPRLPFLLAAIPNLILMRFWLVGKGMEKAGQGVLLLTFVSIIAVFIIF
ncbi:MAG: hypothetical protein RBR84_06905 [Bacteroidales bacterium]|jgi:hypothetical protein|nr:hypothetical protein [Bacteroidales bacterium]MDD4086767.1 hypothetical protein [Bacteroidales bacterium]MDY0085630.1 hypothetical protein [Bacteroidales bacterium]